MTMHFKDIKKIGLFRALNIGDLLCAIPAVRALKKAYPKSEITLISLPWAKSFVQRYPHYFHDFISFPGFKGLPEQPFTPEAFDHFSQLVHKKDFDLLIQMHGNGAVTNIIMEKLQSKYKAGFRLRENKNIQNDLFFEYPQKGHEIRRHLTLMRHLGIPPQGEHIDFPLAKEDYDSLKKWADLLKWRPYVCVHPGTNRGLQQWNPEYFARLADYCVQQGLTVVLTGVQEEMPVIEAVWHHMKYEPVILAGKTTLGGMAALLKNSLMLLANCTGISHLASALEVPSLIINMDGEPERWESLNHELHSTVNWLKSPDFDSVFFRLKQSLSAVQERGEFGDGRYLMFD